MEEGICQLRRQSSSTGTLSQLKTRKDQQQTPKCWRHNKSSWASWSQLTLVPEYSQQTDSCKNTPSRVQKELSHDEYWEMQPGRWTTPGLMWKSHSKQLSTVLLPVLNKWGSHAHLEHNCRLFKENWGFSVTFYQKKKQIKFHLYSNYLGFLYTWRLRILNLPWALLWQFHMH